MLFNYKFYKPIMVYQLLSGSMLYVRMHENDNASIPYLFSSLLCVSKL